MCAHTSSRSIATASQSPCVHSAYASNTCVYLFYVASHPGSAAIPCVASFDTLHILQSYFTSIGCKINRISLLFQEGFASLVVSNHMFRGYATLDACAYYGDNLSPRRNLTNQAYHYYHHHRHDLMLGRATCWLVRYVQESVFGNSGTTGPGSTRLKCMDTSTCQGCFSAATVRTALPADLLRRYERRQAEDALIKAELPGLVKAHCVHTHTLSTH
jgi:hypothetical protein